MPALHEEALDFGVECQRSGRFLDIFSGSDHYITRLIREPLLFLITKGPRMDLLKLAKNTSARRETTTSNRKVRHKAQLACHLQDNGIYLVHRV